MDQIIAFVSRYWVEWLFTGALALITWFLKGLRAQLTEEKQKNEAIAEGVMSLLRESIVSNFNHYREKGWCPIYAKESVKRAYHAYHDGLGGNDVVTELYKKMLAMPESDPNSTDSKSQKPKGTKGQQTERRGESR